MARLIDADKLMWRMGIDSNDRQIFFVTGKDIDEQPTIEAAPVVHGRWERGYPIFCSVCGGAAVTEYEDANRYEAWLSPYCPNCGAKMDRGVSDG